MSKNAAEIRQVFLDFFHSKGHQVLPGSSLVPNNDPTLLFTNAGMNQFKNVFLGLEEPPPSRRATTSQLCVRAGGKHNDLTNVGHTICHHTFFEMLGNFSFGDYFKSDAIQFSWELLTSPKWFNLQKDKLWVTVYATDNESYDVWTKKVGIPYDHIIRIGDNKGRLYSSDNFWTMGDTGPCGPCSEIFYDHGDHIYGVLPGNNSREEHNDRYIEIWNLVFMEFNRTSDGTLQPLPKPSVDTGMGLERISAVLQDVHDNYDIDLFRHLIAVSAQVVGVGTLDMRNLSSLRVISDHIRSCAFLISEGIMPSNEGRGYVLRRIIRRAVRHGHILGSKNIFFYKLVAPLIEVMGSIADQLRLQKSIVEQVLRAEEEQFTRTLKHGLALLNEELTQLTGDTLDGARIFRLYDSYGLPIDLTEEICCERNVKIDKVGFEFAMKAQRNRARESRLFASHDNYHTVMLHIDQSTRFLGYEKVEHQAQITGLFRHGQSVEGVQEGEEAVVVLNETPFYSESGGQIGDCGKLEATTASGPGGQFEVSNTQKYNQAIFHWGRLVYGKLKLGEEVHARVDQARRHCICLNHSATHLLHTALRQVLGKYIRQKGSLVSDKYLRFDFSYHEAMTLNQIRYVEDIINQQIRRNLLIKNEVMAIESARNKGAIALFHDKYDDMQQVRVLSIGDFSLELCGGTHASRTGDIGLFHILSESGIASGIRRIEAVTGEKALSVFRQKSELVYRMAQLVKSDSQNLFKKVHELQERYRQLEKECQKLKIQRAGQESALLIRDIRYINNVKVLVKRLNGIEPRMLRIMVDDLKNHLGSATVIVLASVIDSKISLIVGVTKDLTDRVKASDMITKLAPKISGKGGGRSDLAQAEGSNIAALSSMLTSIDVLLETTLTLSP